MHAFFMIEFCAHMPFFFAVPLGKIFCFTVFSILLFFFLILVLLFTIITTTRNNFVKGTLSLKNVLREQLCDTIEFVYGRTFFVWFIK